MNENTRERLIEGTLEVLREKGVAGASSRAIAAAAGANLGAITYHFGSKDQLIADALLSVVRSWLEPTIECFRSDGDPAVHLLNAVASLRETYTAAHHDVRTYFEAIAQAPRSEVLSEGINRLFSELSGFLADEIAEMKDVGYLQPWVDPTAMANLIVAAGDGVALHAVLAPEQIDIDASLNQVVQLLLAARSNP